MSFLSKPSWQKHQDKSRILKDHGYIPEPAIKLLLEIINQIAEGNTLTLIPEHAHLTTEEAADLLNVSRPFFVKLLESGEIPFEKAGNRRRILIDDILQYKEKIHQKEQKYYRSLLIRHKI